MLSKVLNMYKNKMKEKKGATEIIEVVICIALITLILFYPVSVYQMSQQISYIEDVKTSLVQEMSRTGTFNSSQIQKYTDKIEKIDGVEVVKMTEIKNTVYKDSGTPMTVEIVCKVKPSIFSKLLSGGDYKTKAIIYSEKVRE